MIIIRVGSWWRNAKILPTFVPTVEQSFTFGKTTNGGWYVVDRGHNADMYSAEITFRGTTAEMFDLHELMVGPSSISNLAFVLENNEYIFGPNIDIGTYNCAVTDYSELQQYTLTTWGFSVSITADNVVSTVTPALPATIYPTTSTKIDATNGNSAAPFYTLKTSGGIHTYSSDNDRAVCSMAVEMAHDDAASLLEYYDTVCRGGVIDQFTAPVLSGIPYPFGTAHSYPCAIRILSIDGLQQYTPTRWRMNITIGRNV